MKAGTRAFWTRTDWLKWAALAFALVSTFHAEHALAVAVGVNEHIAYAVPGALDAYVIRTLRAHREVLTAVLAMVAVNAVSYLITFGVLAVTWPVVVGVSAIAPLVLWRVHALGTPGEWRERKLWGLPWRAGTVPVVEHAPDPVEHADTAIEHAPSTETWRCSTGVCGHDACTVTCDWCGYEYNAGRLDVHKAVTCAKRWEHKAGTLDEHADTAIKVVHDTESTGGWDEALDRLESVLPDMGAVDDQPETGTTVLTLVPDLPAGFEHDTHAVPVLHPADRKYERAARTVWAVHGPTCTLRAMKAGAGINGAKSVNTDTARRLLEFLRAEHAHNISTEGSTS